MLDIRLLYCFGSIVFISHTLNFVVFFLQIVIFSRQSSRLPLITAQGYAYSAGGHVDSHGRSSRLVNEITMDY